MSGPFQLRIFDAHTHLSGPDSGETPENIVQTLDACNVEKAFVIAPLITKGSWELDESHLDETRRNNDYCARVCARMPDRLLGFCVLNPAPGVSGGTFGQAVDLMIEEAKRCRHELGLRGVKLIPSGWYPNDPHAVRLYRAVTDLGMYVLFHAGIFLDGMEGTYCKPTYFEAVHQVEGFRGQLAHLAWPWVDECIAVLDMESMIHGKEPGQWQLRADLSFGPPEDWQLRSWQLALDTLPKEMLCYGSDIFWPATPERYLEQYLQPQLGLFEVALTLGHQAGEGSPDRARWRQQIFHDNAWSHWKAAVGADERRRPAAVVSDRNGGRR
jgi:predicted TIM-barrel fold metal-dependent hydrolase